MEIDNYDRLIRQSDQLVSELVAPPRDGLGVCARCHTWNDVPDQPECSNCNDVRRDLETEPLSLSVISLYRKPSVLRDWLTQYKGRPDDQEPFVPGYQEVVTLMLERFFFEHGRFLYERLKGYDAVVIVPSTSRQPPHPLEALVHLALPGIPVLPLLVRGPGDLAFRKPAKDGYVTTGSRTFRGRLLLIDDVYTTGSRLNSAAFALQEAGAEIAGGLVVARRVNVDFDPRAKELWERQSAEAFTWQSGPVLA